MFETTLAYLDTNNPLWSGRAALAAAVTEAKNGVTAIRTAAAQQESPTSGITDEKEQARTDLEDKTLKIADQVAALAAKNGNANLAAQVQMTRSSLDQAQDDTLVQTAQRVRDTGIRTLLPWDPTV